MGQDYTTHLPHLVYFGFVSSALQIDSFSYTWFPVYVVAPSNTLLKSQSQ